MKTFMKVIIWSLYIIALPVYLVFALVVLGWYWITGIREGWGFQFKEGISLLCEGTKEGHQFNMAQVEAIFEE